MEERLLELTIEPLAEGGFLATSVAIQGLIAQGRTLAETLEIARDVARKLLDSQSEIIGETKSFRSVKKKKTTIDIAVTINA